MSTVAHHPEGKLKPIVDTCAFVAKWGFAIGMLALIFAGAGFFLAGKDFPESLQVVAAIGGAIAGGLGGLIAWMVGGPSSDD